MFADAAADAYVRGDDSDPAAGATTAVDDDAEAEDVSTLLIARTGSLGGIVVTSRSYSCRRNLRI